jgi:hypothetical protein
MRKLCHVLAAAGLAAGIAGAASAAPLSFRAGLDIEIATLDPISVTVDGVATVNGSSGGGALDSLHLDAGAIAATTLFEVTDPLASPIQAVSALVSNGAGTLAATGGALAGAMALNGSAIICLFTSTCEPPFLFEVPLVENGTRGVGLGGGVIHVGGAIAVSVQGAPWTTGPVQAQSSGIGRPTIVKTIEGFAHGPASGGLSSAATVGGVVSLVSPVQVNTDIGPSLGVPIFTRLKLTFVPEPAVLSLVGAALLTLFALRRRRKTGD